jgi:ABC-2 type transport system permease protein
MNRILAIIRKEFKQMIRDRLTLGFVLLLPVIQLLLFGYGIQTEVKHIPTAVFDQSLTAESRSLIDTFKNSGYFNIDYAATSYAGVTALIDSGRAKAGIIFPPDYARDLQRGGATVQVVVDASDNLVANQAVAAANSISQVQSLQVLVQKYNISNSQPYDVEVRPWYNPDGIAAYYMLPALLGMILSLMMMLQTSICIVRERERGTLEQLLVTPIRPYELMIGKVVPNFVLGNVLVTISLLVACLVFGVPIRGSLLQLYLLSMFFITASLGMGIMISNFARNQLQAMQLTFFALFPSMVLTGFVWPRLGMPKVIYYIGMVFPITYYFDIIRGVMLKGIGFRYLIGQTGALLAFSVIFMTVATLSFKKRIV